MKPSCRRILSALITADVNGLTAGQLSHPSIGGINFRKRCSELRKEGFNIIVIAWPSVVRPYRRYILQGRTNEEA